MITTFDDKRFWGVLARTALAIETSKKHETLLIWLSKEDACPFGACKGEALSDLLRDGLAEMVATSATTPMEYWTVRLTAAGREAARIAIERSEAK